MSEVHFVIPAGQTLNDPIHHIAIQAAAVIMKDWMEENEPSVDEAKAMAEALVSGLMGRKPVPM